MSPALPRLILASTSPYRRDLLSRLAIPFGTLSPDVDETPLPGETPVDLALRLSIAKAASGARARPGCVIIGSDQVATMDGRPIGKPGNHERAAEQLRGLSGREVLFYSAMAVTDGTRMYTANVLTECRFRRLSESAIQTYLHAEVPYDTAGSAKAEGLGIALMEHLRSEDPTAIVGLPLIALTRLLGEFGIDPLAPRAGGSA